MFTHKIPKERRLVWMIRYLPEKRKRIVVIISVVLPNESKIELFAYEKPPPFDLSSLVFDRNTVRRNWSLIDCARSSPQPPDK